jgi:DNA-binding XRE family transcriptional regulator
MEDQFKTTSIDELISRDIGRPGTKEREKFDAKVQTAVIAYQLKELRKKQNITQQQLAEMVGIDKTQISKIEKGSRNLTIETIARIVNALGGTFDLNIKMV